ncbi:hypothetical protein ELG94_40015, partial [Rhizobium ruizarguesonis]
ELEGFVAEDAALLHAGLVASPYVTVDDTGARHSHNNYYTTQICSRKVEVSCFCKVGMSLSPGLMTVEIADGTDSDERARPAADR